jgi:hypothetical protein
MSGMERTLLTASNGAVYFVIMITGTVATIAFVSWRFPKARK